MKNLMESEKMDKKEKNILKVVFAVIALLLVNIAIISYVGADSPVITYAYPDDNDTFSYADTREGEGAYWAINISDVDVDLNRIVLQENSSGTWSDFYDSGSLGGVAYHNTSGYNTNWTASWEEYYWRICALDGVDWYNTTYSFTTGYQWGEKKMVIYDNVKSFFNPIMLRNDTGEYYLWFDDGSSMYMKESTTGTNWSLVSTNTSFDSEEHPDNAFVYNDSVYLSYSEPGGSNDYHKVKYKQGSSWIDESIGILCSDDHSSYSYRDGHVHGIDAIYYNGEWNIVVGRTEGGTSYYDHLLEHYTGTFPNNWERQFILLSNEHHYNSGDDYYSWFEVELEILDGLLYLTYMDDDEDFHYQTYDGVSWTDHGDILNGNYVDCREGGFSMTKDMVNNQLVCAMVERGTPQNITYYVFNGTSWEGPHLVFQAEEGKTIQDVEVSYIDSRLTCAFSYNLRDTYDIYTISAPGYTKIEDGIDTIYNRIQFPDAAPGNTNVNSTVFTIKNIDNRNIISIDWHFENIGDINISDNLRIWTNLSGTWQSWSCDMNGDIDEIDISSVAGGQEWQIGDKTYWKLEILTIGDVAEDFHATDEDIFYKITLEE